MASPTSDVGRGENVCCPGSAAKFRGDHESAHRHTSDKHSNRNGWVLLQHLWAQSQKTAHYYWHPGLFHFIWPFGPQSSTRLTQVALIATSGAGVAQRRISTGRPLLYLPQPTQNIMLSCEQQVCEKDLADGTKYHECEQETLLNYKQWEENKTIYDDEDK